jgi:putative NADPH-quinone reductase
MGKRILIINGHPDPALKNFCCALADAYGAGARSGNHELRRIDVGTLGLPLIHTAKEFEGASELDVVRTAQTDIAWCEHMVIVHPLWLGAAPAVLKGFFEQTLRYGFALPAPGSTTGFPQGLLKGRSARIVVTMGMPAFVYRWYFGAFAVRAMEGSMLGLSGFRPVRRTLIGGMGDLTPVRAADLLETMRQLGARAA